MEPTHWPLQLQLTMLVHPNFSHRATVAADDHRWVPSPQPGVTRYLKTGHQAGLAG